METILVIDDAPKWRDMTAAVLRRDGYEVLTAGNGIEGLETLSRQPADLLIVEVQMSGMNGLLFLEKMRRHDQWKDIPVIMLTADTQKEHILRARRLGAVEYLLKPRFSAADFLARIQKRIGHNHAVTGVMPAAPVREHVCSGVPGAGETSSPAHGSAVPRHTANAPEAKPAPKHRTPVPLPRPATSGETIPRLLTREQCMQRVDQALAGRSLSGIVAEVIALTSSPRGDLSDVTRLITRDPLLTVRVLQAANSVGNASLRGRISSIQDAVRNIGCAAVRNIAATMGVFDAMPPPEPDGFNAIRCWQHSFATAALCEKFAPPDESGNAYLAGLCHDLGEILFRSHFGAEYRRVLEAREATGRPQFEIERAMLGMTHAELAQETWKSVGLPAAIYGPVAEFLLHRGRGHIKGRLANLLNVTDLYANGLMLATSEQSLISPLSRIELRAAVGQEEVPAPDAAVVRAAIFSLTAMLARLRPQEESQLTKPLYAALPREIWLARDSSFSAFDPIAAAVESLARLRIENRLPTPGELDAFNGVIVLGRSARVAGFTASDISQLAAARPARPPDSFLWLTSATDENPISGPILPAAWPIPLSRLAAFTAGLN